MEPQTQNSFAQYAPLAWSAVVVTTVGLFMATLYLASPKRRKR